MARKPVVYNPTVRVQPKGKTVAQYIQALYDVYAKNKHWIDPMASTAVSFMSKALFRGTELDPEEEGSEMVDVHLTQCHLRDFIRFFKGTAFESRYNIQ